LVGKYGKIQGEGLLQAFLDTAVKYKIEMKKLPVFILDKGVTSTW
jgi:hypothetical protein